MFRRQGDSGVPRQVRIVDIPVDELRDLLLRPEEAALEQFSCRGGVSSRGGISDPLQLGAGLGVHNSIVADLAGNRACTLPASLPGRVSSKNVWTAKPPTRFVL